MASQQDLFLSSPETSPKLNSSLPAKITYVYLWCILFDWDEDEEFPFKLYQLAIFSNSELKPKWVSGELDNNSRKKPLSFSAVPGKTVSLFAKVEKCKF